MTNRKWYHVLCRIFAMDRVTIEEEFIVESFIDKAAAIERVILLNEIRDKQGFLEYHTITTVEE